MKRLRTCILSQGSELLMGSIQDANACWIASLLFGSEYDVLEFRTAGDDVNHLTQTYQELIERYDVIISTGGIGPTEDDLTSAVLANIAKVELVSSPEALAHIQHRYAARNREIDEGALKMTRIPDGSHYIENPLGSACGYRMNIQHCSIYVFPGVPIEFQPMAEATFAHRSQISTPLVLGTFGLSESAIQRKLADLHLPPMAFHATRRAIWLTLFPDERRKSVVREQIIERIGESIFSIHNQKQSLVDVVAQQLWDRGEMIATAESCTAGKLSSWFTSIPGSSAYYKEGVIVYSNEAKHKYCGVSMDLIQAEGAVCKQVAIDLARGIQERSGATWGMGITGIAGPGGGTPDKPVGTVHIAVYGHGRVHHSHNLFSGTRDQITDQASAQALMMLHKAIEDLQA